jgi:uncharacterized protein (TIGR02466 family)
MITVQTIPLFQSSVAYGKIFGFDKKNLVNEILKLETTADSNLRSNAGGYQSTSFDIKAADNPYASELFKDTVMPILNEVATSWGFPVAKNLSYWYNVNRKYNYNHSHYHPQAILSGVLYLKVPTNSGKITFTRASSEADRLDFLTAWHYETNQLVLDNPNTNVLHSKEPEENLLIIFPGHLEHYVEQNLTEDLDDSRISVSFNYFLG